MSCLTTIKDVSIVFRMMVLTRKYFIFLISNILVLLVFKSWKSRIREIIITGHLHVTGG